MVFEPAEDGMAWLHAFVPAVEALAIYNRMTAQAKVLAAEPAETRDSINSARTCSATSSSTASPTAFHRARAAFEPPLW